MAEQPSGSPRKETAVAGLDSWDHANEHWDDNFHAIASQESGTEDQRRNRNEKTNLARDLLGKQSKGHPVVDVHGERHLWVIIFKNEEDYETWEMAQEDQATYRAQRIEIVSDIKKLGIKVTKHKSRDGDEKFVKLYASQELLERLAERCEWKVKLKRGQYVPFVCAHRHLYAVPEPFRGHDKEGDDLESRGVEIDDYDEHDFHFSSADAAMIVLTAMERKQELGGAGISMELLCKDGCVEHYFPTHREEEVEWLQTHWGNFGLMATLFLNQPLERVKEYFGTQIALYFTFLGFYTKWLCAPALVGVYAFAVQMAQGDMDVKQVVPLFAFFMCFWGTLFLEYWKRKEITCAFRWGTLGFESEEVTRSEFVGTARLHPITGEPEDHYPPEKRQVKFYLSVLIALVCTTIVGAGIALVLAFRYFLIQHLGAGAAVIPGILNGLMIAVFNAIYEVLAEILTHWENHKTQTSYDDALIVKTFMFQFVNSYVSFYLVAFIKPYGDYFGTEDWFGKCKCKTFNQYGCSESNIVGPGTPTAPDGSQNGLMCSCNKYSCIDELSILLLCIFLVQLFLDNFIEWGVPYFQARYAMYLEEEKLKAANNHNSPGVASGETAIDETVSVDPLCQAEMESKLAEYTLKDHFKDYNELVIQYGFVSLFSAAFPLCALLALVNNVVEIRSDAGKMLRVMQRPQPRNAEDLGSWFTIMDVMTYICVVTNCLLVWFTSSAVEHLSMGDRIWGFILSEHIIIGIKVGMAYAIPDVPPKTQEAMEREAYRVKRAAEEVLLDQAGTTHWSSIADEKDKMVLDDDIYDEDDGADPAWMELK